MLTKAQRGLAPSVQWGNQEEGTGGFMNIWPLCAGCNTMVEYRTPPKIFLIWSQDSPLINDKTLSHVPPVKVLDPKPTQFHQSVPQHGVLSTMWCSGPDYCVPHFLVPFSSHDNVSNIQRDPSKEGNQGWGLPSPALMGSSVPHGWLLLCWATPQSPISSSCLCLPTSYWMLHMPFVSTNKTWSTK